MSKITNDMIKPGENKSIENIINQKQYEAPIKRLLTVDSIEVNSLYPLIGQKKPAPAATESLINNDEVNELEEEEDCNIPAIIQDKTELLELETKFKKSKYFQLIKRFIKNELPIEEMEIPDLVNDDEAKLYYRNVTTIKTEIINDPSKVNLKKIDNRDFSNSLDVLDTSNEQPINSWYGRLFSLLVVTITPTNHFNIITLSILYGNEFLKACFFVTIFFCMPFMFLEILIGQFSPINVSTFFSKISQAWNVVCIFFVINFYIYGIYSLIYGIYSFTEVLNILTEMTISKTAINPCPENSNNTCIRPDLAYYCLYSPKKHENYDLCQMYHEMFEKSYYRQDINHIHNSRFIEKLEYIFDIIPSQRFILFVYLCVVIVWFLVAIFKRNGYCNNSGIMVFFYISYISSLIGLLVILFKYKDGSFFQNSAYFLFSETQIVDDANVEVWVIAFCQMIKTFKSGQGVVMKISSYFPKHTNSTNIAFLVCGINFGALSIHVITWLKIMEKAVKQDAKDDLRSLLTMSKSDIRTYLSSSLALFVDNNLGYSRSFALLFHFIMVGISTYEAFVYIDLLDCELHNIGIKHNRYATARYKTTAAITFLFLLLPISAIIYPTIGKFFFIIEETLDYNSVLCLWQLFLIIFGIGYNKIPITGSAKFLTHFFNLILGKYFTFFVIPGLVLFLSVILEGEHISDWKKFIRESTDPNINRIVNLLTVWSLRICILIWPLFQMIRSVIYGKKSTFIFKCQLTYTK